MILEDMERKEHLKEFYERLEEFEENNIEEIEYLGLDNLVSDFKDKIFNKIKRLG